MVSKARAEDRYSFGPLYSPGVNDAHGEHVDAGVLQSALWRYMDTSDRLVNLQHRRGTHAGRVVEAVCWPEAHTATLTVPDGVSKGRSVTFPAGTVYVGTVWEPWAWGLVKSGALQGLSMGGSAKRIRGVEADFEAGALEKALESAPAVTVRDLVEHDFIEGPAGRCLLDSHSRDWHVAKAAKQGQGLRFAPAYQPPLIINDAAGLMAALEGLGKLRDQQTALAQIREAAARLGLIPLLEAALAAKQSEATHQGHVATVQSLVSAHQAQAAEGTLAGLSGSQGQRQSGYVQPRGQGGIGRRNRRQSVVRQPSGQGGQIEPGSAQEREPGPTTSAGGSPGAIEHGNDARSNAGGGHGQRPYVHRGSDPKHLAKEASASEMSDTYDYGVRDLSALAATPEDQALVAKHRASAEQVRKMRDWEPEPADFPAAARVPGDWMNVPADIYEAHRRGEMSYTDVCKAVAEDVYVTNGEIGQAWMDSLNDPAQMAAANAAYEAYRRGDDLDLDDDLDDSDSDDLDDGTST